MYEASIFRNVKPEDKPFYGEAGKQALVTGKQLHAPHGAAAHIM
jgi:hypothetical protein